MCVDCARRLWNDVFCVAQDMLGIPRGTIRGTVLIETLLASFEMEEIIYELREHSSGGARGGSAVQAMTLCPWPS